MTVDRRNDVCQRVTALVEAQLCDVKFLSVSRRAMVLCLVISCARPDTELPPVGVASGTSRAAPTMSAARQQGLPDTAHVVPPPPPSGYSLPHPTARGPCCS